MSSARCGSWSTTPATPRRTRAPTTSAARRGRTRADAGARKGFVATPPAAGPALRSYQRPIDDWTAYNAFTNAGGSELVRDSRALCALDCPAGARAGVRLITDGDVFEVRFDPAAGRVEALRNDAPFAQARCPAGAGKRLLDVGRADERLIVYVDDALVLAKPFSSARETTTISRVQLLADAGPVTFRRVRLYRDLHYLRHIRRPERYRRKFGNQIFPFTVAPGHYFAMGDNAPNSTDSRVWGSIPQGHMVGRAFCVFWPAVPTDWAVRRLR